MSQEERFSTPETFVQYRTSDPDLLRYLWRSEPALLQPGSMKLIHAPSHWDDIAFAPQDENQAGEAAFYTVLCEAYQRFSVDWVLFVKDYA